MKFEFSKFKDELKKEHLIKKDGTVPALIVLKCRRCGLKLRPASLFFRKLQLEKKQLICERCKGRIFVRTDHNKTQGELMVEALKRTKTLNKFLEDETSPWEKKKAHRMVHGEPLKIIKEVEGRKIVKVIGDES